jgi:hypothetical protein
MPDGDKRLVLSDKDLVCAFAREAAKSSWSQKPGSTLNVPFVQAQFLEHLLAIRDDAKCARVGSVMHILAKKELISDKDILTARGNKVLDSWLQALREEGAEALVVDAPECRFLVDVSLGMRA